MWRASAKEQVLHVGGAVPPNSSGADSCTCIPGREQLPTCLLAYMVQKSLFVLLFFLVGFRVVGRRYTCFPGYVHRLVIFDCLHFHAHCAKT